MRRRRRWACDRCCPGRSDKRPRAGQENAPRPRPDHAARRVQHPSGAASRRTALAYGGVLIGPVIAAATVGAFWGKASANVAVHETERGLTTAFQDGPAAASIWLNFMQANDGNLVGEACAKSTFKTADGRRACAVGLWVDPPTKPAPPYRAQWK
jgi:hypothetical protein